MALQSYDGYEQIIDEIKARVNRSFAEYDKYNSPRPYDVNSPINDLRLKVVSEIENLQTEIDCIMEGRMTMMEEEYYNEEA